jgi:hypothetical protein
VSPADGTCPHTSISFLGRGNALAPSDGSSDWLLSTVDPDRRREARTAKVTRGLSKDESDGTRERAPCQTQPTRSCLTPTNTIRVALLGGSIGNRSRSATSLEFAVFITLRDRGDHHEGKSK